MKTIPRRIVVAVSTCSRPPTSQNPESSTWEARNEPAPIATVTRLSCAGLADEATIAGPSRPAVVVMATVAEP